MKDAPGVIPTGGWDPGEGSTCAAATCPPDPWTSKPGRCCRCRWCSCGDLDAADL